MMSMRSLLAALLLLPMAASAQEQGRIKRQPPTRMEAERIASDIVMNDGLLQKGDIVVTDRGFFVFQGVGADGYSFNFAPIPSPLPVPRR
jgi:hypothetical protein